MKPLVYIAGPYTLGDPVKNTRTAMLWGNHVVDIGAAPLIPHLSLAWHLVTPRDEQFWYDYTAELLRRCDALLRIPGASKGADNEVKLAGELGIPVFTKALELEEWVKGETGPETARYRAAMKRAEAAAADLHHGYLGTEQWCEKYVDELEEKP